MKIAQAAPDDGSGPITLLRPVTAKQLGIALHEKPYIVIRELMEIEIFVSLLTEISDDEVLRYSRSAEFDYLIDDRE